MTDVTTSQVYGLAPVPETTRERARRALVGIWERSGTPRSDLVEVLNSLGLSKRVPDEPILNYIQM